MESRSTKIIVFVILNILLSGRIYAQHTASDSVQLKKLDGHRQEIYFSSQFQDRADEIAQFMDEAADFFGQELKFTPSVQLFILGPEDWPSIAANSVRDVYGFPHNIDEHRLAIAAEDNAFWQSFLPPVNNLPAPLAEAVTNAYGKSDGTYSMMPFFDLLALHEMGHSYTAQAGLNMQRHWMSELFVNIMLHTFVAEEKPELLPALETFPNMVVAGGSEEFEFTSLEDFERLYSTLGMGPKNYGWYQCRLHVAAREIYDAGGKEVLNRLWMALLNHQEDMSDTAFAEMLQAEVHPSVADVYLKW